MIFLFKFIQGIECILFHWLRHERISIFRDSHGTVYTYICNKCGRKWEEDHDYYN
jgi:hypothetical protein